MDHEDALSARQISCSDNCPEPAVFRQILERMRKAFALAASLLGLLLLRPPLRGAALALAEEFAETGSYRSSS